MIILKFLPSKILNLAIAGSGDSNLDAPDDLDDDVFATDSAETPMRPWSRKPLIMSRNFTPICPSVSVTHHLDEEDDFYNEDDLAMPLCSMRPSSTAATSAVTDLDRPPMDPECARPNALSLATVSPCVNCHKCYGLPNFMSSLSSDAEPSMTNSEPKKLNLTPKNSCEGTKASSRTHKT